MTDYDFKTLNDKEFEVMCTDLLSSKEGFQYERFKAGKDAGVDGRFFSSNKQETILQCKHWIATSLDKLISRLKSEEKPKIEKLNPTRYIVMVSHSLSRKDKTAIATALAPYVKIESDIFGREDLNDLLARYPEIEQRHYKLWLSSTNVLQYMLNKPIYDRSHDELESIKDLAHLYVKTANHEQAIKQLEGLKTIIITGSPGIGKTTLAKQLLLYYVIQGFKLFVIDEDIQEAETVFNYNEQQVFYFDDFLGRNYLEALKGHEGSKIVRFIERVYKSKNTRLILTSRTTILNQGKILHDAFQHKKIEKNEYELKLDLLSNLDKAKILYNHLWHSNLNKDFIEQIYLNKRYRDIVKHSNFNPRLISYFTDYERINLNNISILEYWAYVFQTLKNPIDIWDNSFVVQLKDFGRALVLLVTLNAHDIDEQSLIEAYQRYISMPEHSNLQGERDFFFNVKHLTNSFLKRTIFENKVTFNLFNPSIGDYVLRRYSSDIASLKTGFTCLRSVSSLNTLYDFSKNEIINTRYAEKIANALLDKAIQVSFKEYTTHYIAKLIVIIKGYDLPLIPNEVNITKAIDFLINSNLDTLSTDCLEVFDWAFTHKIVEQEFIFNYIEKKLEKYVNYSELEIIISLINKFDDDTQELISSSLEEAITTYLEYNVDTEFSAEEIFESIEKGNYSDAEKILEDLIDDKVWDITRNSNLNIYISRERILNAFDIERQHDQYFESLDSDYCKVNFSPTDVDMDEIDDLFEQT